MSASSADTRSGLIIIRLWRAEDGLGGASFTGVTLQPVVEVADESMAEPSLRLHTEANKMCFLARSMNFPVVHKPEVRVRVRA